MIFIITGEMMDEIHAFNSACANFTTLLNTIRSDEVLSQKFNIIRLVMDKFMNLERAFILPEGLPKRPFYK